MIGLYCFELEVPNDDGDDEDDDGNVGDEGDEENDADGGDADGGDADGGDEGEIKVESGTRETGVC